MEFPSLVYYIKFHKIENLLIPANKIENVYFVDNTT